ncbi:MAG: DUF1549 domain-containing protein [Pirellula sp.]
MVSLNLDSRCFAIVHWIVLFSFALALLGMSRIGTTRGDINEEKDSVRFDYHVQPLLTKLGCNAGSCHGNARGQGGFRLSLFGADQAFDLRAILESSNRVDVKNPERSLILKKPSGQEDHEGGVRFEKGGWEYQTLLDWIRHIDSGAKADTLAQLVVTPSRILLADEESTAKINVMATFASGECKDVTSFSVLRVQNDNIAELQQYTVKRKRVGETHVIATYLGWSANASVVVPNTIRLEGTSVNPRARSNHCVDSFIDSKLDDLGTVSAPICDDYTFLRRVALTTTGQLPSKATLETFCASQERKKRESMVAKFLSSPLHAAKWATRMSEILGSRDMGKATASADIEKQWHAWFVERFQKNTAYDKMVHEILTSTTRQNLSAAEYLDQLVLLSNPTESFEPQKGLMDSYWKRPSDNEDIMVESLAERTSAAFLGIRIECAKCHKHPFDRWTQNDYRAFANIFAQVRYGLSAEMRETIFDRLEQQRKSTGDFAERKKIPSFREVYLAKNDNDFRSIGKQEPLLPRSLGSSMILQGNDRRIAFADWLLSDGKRLLARNFVNRVWENCFGRGLVEPVDSFSAAHPPSHPELLEELAKQFIEHDFDIRWLEHCILTSNAWQRSSMIDVSTSDEGQSYSRFAMRVLSADAILDSISCALENESGKAITNATYRSEDGLWQSYFDVFARRPRTAVCDCDRRNDPTLRQAMLLLSDEQLLHRIEEYVKVHLPKREELSPWIEGKFLQILCRPAKPAELEITLGYITNSAELNEACTDFIWSLFNTREFVTLH